MKMIVFYTNSLSPHQLPLAREIVRLVGSENYRYIYTAAMTDERRAIGWKDVNESWILHESDAHEEAMRLVSEADVLMTTLRCLDVIEARAAMGKKTYYCSERWFKPPLGFWRLLHPGYFVMAWRIVKKIMPSPYFVYLPDGIHATHDMARLCGLFAGDLRCLFRAPRLEFERKPGGRVLGRVERVETCRRGDEGGRVEKRYCLDKMRMWGYFVEEGKRKREEGRDKNQLRVLWVGRLLGLKRVDTIIRAVGEISTRSTRLESSSDHLVSTRTTRLEPSSDPLHVSTCSTRLNITLDIYGAGPEEMRLRKLASKYGDVIKFYPPVPIGEVRNLMREHDVYVMASDETEGWGAVVTEALEEGMCVIGTREAGACATILPKDHLFAAGDYAALADMLAGWRELSANSIGEWNAISGAKRFLQMAGVETEHDD